MAETTIDVSRMSYNQLLELAQRVEKLPDGFIDRLNKVSPLMRERRPDGLRSVPTETVSSKLIRRKSKHLSD